MSTETNKKLARRVFDEILNTGNPDRADELASTDLVVHYAAAPEPLRGLAAYKQAFVADRAALPDQHFTIEDTIAEGEKVVVRWKMRATHQGEYLGIPATGKQVSLSGVSIYQIVDGKVAEAWVSANDLGLMQQLGAIPEPQQAA